MSNQLLINIDVPDLQAGIEFYEVGLGFELQRLMFGRSVAEMSLDSASIFLIQQDSGSSAIPGTQAKRTYEDHWTPVHLDVIVGDLDEAMARAAAAGAKLSSSASEHVWGRLAAMRDPFGHGFCLIAFQDGGYDLVESA